MPIVKTDAPKNKARLFLAKKTIKPPTPIFHMCLAGWRCKTQGARWLSNSIRQAIAAILSFLVTWRRQTGQAKGRSVYIDCRFPTLSAAPRQTYNVGGPSLTGHIDAMVSGSHDETGAAHRSRENASAEQSIAMRDNQIDSRQLFQGGREISIVHGAETYRLRLTAQNKLILTK